MEQIEGLKIDGMGFPPKKQGDLLYHEGPLLSHFTNEESPSEHYFYKWADADEHCHRWLIFKVSEQHLKAFFEKSLTCFSSPSSIHSPIFLIWMIRFLKSS